VKKRRRNHTSTTTMSYVLSPVKLRMGRPPLLGEESGGSGGSSGGGSGGGGGGGGSGTAYTVSDQSNALKNILQEQAGADEAVHQLTRQLNILQAKLESDLRRTRAECESKIGAANRTAVDRQLRHELAVNELRSVYVMHEEAIKTISPHRRVEDVNTKFSGTLRMESMTHALNPPPPPNISLHRRRKNPKT
jgi:hypothetical protein